MQRYVCVVSLFLIACLRRDKEKGKERRVRVCMSFRTHVVKWKTCIVHTCSRSKKDQEVVTFFCLCEYHFIFQTLPTGNVLIPTCEVLHVPL